MVKLDFSRQEALCQSRFQDAGRCFHICSLENHPVLFHNEREFKAAMNIVAFVALSFPDIVVYTFQVMNNHFHLAVSGDPARIELFLRRLIAKLAALPELRAYHADIKLLSFKILPAESLENFRNVIAYINRNGSVVDPDNSPFTYPWGANRFFFNQDAKLRVHESARKATCVQKRDIFLSDLLAKEAGILLLDGYVSPLCFCNIDKAESFFRSCRHYFQSVSRNIESSRDIARSIGENIFYNDDDLFSLVVSLCSKKYDGRMIRELTRDEKVEIARTLHYDYNSSNKQIARILKMDISVVTLLFPV